MSTAASSRYSIASPSLAIARRFLWKELRRMRGFAAGVGVLTLGTMLFFRWALGPTDFPKAASEGALLLIGFFGAAFVAIGGAITAYAVEREEQTDSFLYNLPRHWLPTFMGKLTSTLLLALAFAVVMSLAAWCVGGGRWPSATAGWNVVKLGLTMIVEATAWGTLLSLVCPRPLLAAVLACAATSISSQVAIAITGGLGYRSSDFATAIPVRLAICCAVFALSAVLARHWMMGASRRRWRRTAAASAGGLKPTSLSRPDAAVVQQSLQLVGASSRRSVLLRLVWQTLRESWRAMLAVVAVGMLLMVSVEALHSYTSRGMFVELPLTLFFIPGLCGALAFRCDQRRNQYQFLAEHAGRPRLVWLVRVATWGAFLLVLLVPLVLLAVALAARLIVPEIEMLNAAAWNNATIAGLRIATSNFFYYGVLNFTLAALTAFAVGQLASLLLKSEILAGGVSLLASVVILMFCYLIVAWRLPTWWCLLPICIGCLVASYVRLPDRLVDGHSRGRWAGVVLAVALPIAVVSWSIPLIRQAQIDEALARATPRSSSGQPSLSEAIYRYEQQMENAAEVSREYQVILREVFDAEFGHRDFEVAPSESFMPADAQLLAETYPTQIDRLAELTRKAPVVAIVGIESWPSDVLVLLAADYKRALEGGDLDTALDRYLAIQRFRGQLLSGSQMVASSLFQNFGFDAIAPSELLVDWATAPGQTPERVKQAIGALHEVERQYPPLYHFLIGNYLDAQAVLAGRATLPGQTTANPSDIILFLDSLPEEHKRTEKALEVFATLSLDYVQRVGGMIGAPLRKQLRFDSFVHHGPTAINAQTVLTDSIPYIERQQRMWQTAASSLLAQEIWKSLLNVEVYLRDYLLLHTRLRLERLRLALVAYHLEHSEYPTTVRELAPDYIAPLDIDIFSGEMFQYAPRGLIGNVRSRDYPHGFGYLPDIPAGTPIIWSVGPSNVTPKTLGWSHLLNDNEADPTSADNADSPSVGMVVIFFKSPEGFVRPTVVLPLPTSNEYPETDGP